MTEKREESYMRVSSPLNLDRGFVHPYAKDKFKFLGKLLKMTLVTPSPAQSRPLAPHLQVYRPQLTSVLSIMHRLTGIALSLGTIPLVIWLGAIAMGQEAYQTISIWFSSPLGITLLLGWAFCFYFHLANGIRHLFWDIGWGYDLKDVYLGGWMVVGCTFGLTILTFWWIVYP
jgi:succinate dehydrogenase / fumarate reductase cytochrome b subunit